MTFACERDIKSGTAVSDTEKYLVLWNKNALYRMYNFQKLMVWNLQIFEARDSRKVGQKLFVFLFASIDGIFLECFDNRPDFDIDRGQSTLEL